MLGTSAELLKYQTINDFHSPADYLDYMFGGIQGVMYRATINPMYHQDYYRASGLIKANYDGVDNCYVAMNSFFRVKGLKPQDGRAVEFLKRLNALYVDIDCYKVGLTKSEVLLILADEYIGKKIPEPTFIIDSGRGLYLIWKLRNEDKKALPRWTAVEQYLTDTLEELGADQACTDAARILRVPFANNTKSNTAVTILEFADLTYSIYDIAKEYEINTRVFHSFKPPVEKSKMKHPYNHATEAQRKYVRDIANRLDLSEETLPNFTDFSETDNWIKIHKGIKTTHSEEKGYCYKDGNRYSLPEWKSIKSVLGSYCAEIRKLFTIRKGANCKREIGLFLYRYFLREMKFDSDSALKETLAFNASLDCPFDEAYVTKVTASADRRVDKGVPYAYRKDTIIKILEITKEELKELPFLAAGVKSKKERRSESNRKAYESRLSAEGKTAKKDAILNRRASILAMQEQGKSATEIQKELQISKATYHRDIAALAVASVLDAAKAILEAQAEKVADTMKETAEAVKDAIKSVKNSGVTAVACAAINKAKKLAKSVLSHFFSLPFIEMNTEGVLHSRCLLQRLSQLIRWLNRRRMGDRVGDAGDDDGCSD